MKSLISIAAVSDLHFKPADAGKLRARVEGVRNEADLLLLPGDLIDSGTPEDAQLFVEELARLDVPTVAVLGNHEFMTGQVEAVANVYRRSGIRLLDGDTTDFVIRGESLGIVGTRGARGGFGEHALGPTGEPEVNYWLDTLAGEVDKIETGLGSLITDYRVVLLHYSPIRETVEGEASEEIPFYGSSALCEPIDRLGATLVVHGHSHHGTHRGSTPTGIPVYNVAASVIPAPYVILELGQ
jgi:Icc-related predicted phosphoesterase